MPSERRNKSAKIYPSLGGRTYDWPIWQAVKYVGKVVADDDVDGCYPSARTSLRHAALNICTLRLVPNVLMKDMRRNRSGRCRWTR